MIFTNIRVGPSLHISSGICQGSSQRHLIGRHAPRRWRHDGQSRGWNGCRRRWWWRRRGRCQPHLTAAVMSSFAALSSHLSLPTTTTNCPAHEQPCPSSMPTPPCPHSRHRPPSPHSSHTPAPRLPWPPLPAAGSVAAAQPPLPVRRGRRPLPPLQPVPHPTLRSPPADLLVGRLGAARPGPRARQVWEETCEKCGRKHVRSVGGNM
eukprot:350616-Chlamydomonas_euryale.AAC.7